MFSCEFCEIFHNIFFKKHFGRLLHHKHLFCLLSHHDLSLFQKQCFTYVLAEYFFGLICRRGRRVSSIFQAFIKARSLFLTQSNICDGVFFAKIVNSLKKPLSTLSKKSFIVMLNQVLNMPLYAATVCSHRNFCDSCKVCTLTINFSDFDLGKSFNR